MQTRLAVPLVLVLAAVVLAAGCGGGGSSGEQLTKAEYAAKLDTICTETNEAGKSLDLASISKLATSGGEAKALLDKMIDRINSLEPPDEVQDAASSFVAGLEQESKDFGELTQAAKDGDAAKVRQIQGELSSEAAATSEDARFIGATGCARLFA